jgi:hypothetical protein
VGRSSAPLRVRESKRESSSDVTAMSQVARIGALERAQAFGERLSKLYISSKTTWGISDTIVNTTIIISHIKAAEEPENVTPSFAFLLHRPAC